MARRLTDGELDVIREAQRDAEPAAWERDCGDWSEAEWAELDAACGVQAVDWPATWSEAVRGWSADDAGF